VERKTKMASKKPAPKKSTKKVSDPTPIYTQVVKARGFDPLKNKPENTAMKSIPANMTRKSNASRQKKGK
jgi:hypothetical protein